MTNIRYLAFIWLTVVLISSTSFAVKILYDFCSQPGNPAFLFVGALGAMTLTLFSILALATPSK